MAAGSVITGKDGIVGFAADNSAGAIAAATEAACLTDWSINSSATFETTATQCMLSNADGGSGVAAGWDEQEVTGKSWTMDLTNFWQSASNAGAQSEIEPTQVGERKYVVLYPNKKTTGSVYYHGYARINNVTPTASVSGKITQTISLTGDGALTRSVVA